MIARFRVQLPTRLLVPAAETLARVDADAGLYRAIIFPPYRSELAESADVDLPIAERPPLLRPAVAPTRPAVQMDGADVVEADALQVDFHAETFDRATGANDPPLALAFELANSFIARFRTLARAFQVDYLTPEKCTWRIEYLNDDETELDSIPGLARARVGAAFVVQLVGLPVHMWEAVHSLPIDYEPPPADELLLDAFARLPHVGAAIVLGFAAIETRIELVLNQLARLTGIRRDVWNWVNDRGDYRKEPSTEEQFDSVLQALTGRTLKEDPRLWEAFKNLRTARNSFAHDGTPSIAGTPVTEPRAVQLLQVAGEIMDWLDSLLPEPQRRPRHEASTQFEAITVFAAPEPPAGEHSPPEA